MRNAIRATKSAARRTRHLSSSQFSAAFVALALAISTPSFCLAQVTGLGSAANYGILEDNGQIQVHSGTASVTTSLGASGNVGLLQGSGSATQIIVHSDASMTVGGTLSYSESALPVQLNPPNSTFIAGSEVGSQGSSLTSAWGAATSASSADGALASTTSISSNTITGTQAVNVVNVSSITSDLTISGTASQVFVINVTGSIGLSNVSLSGGVTANNVLFNITGGGSVMLGGGTVNGTFLDTAGGITLNGTTLNGALISGGASGISISSDSSVKITTDSFTAGSVSTPELPTISMASVACLLVLGGAGLRRVRRARAA